MKTDKYKREWIKTSEELPEERVPVFNGWKPIDYNWPHPRLSVLAIVIDRYSPTLSYGNFDITILSVDWDEDFERWEWKDQTGKIIHRKRVKFWQYLPGIDEIIENNNDK